MTEHVQTITCCDNCYPGIWPPVDFFPGLTEITGVFRGTFEEALKNGWEERDYGHVCPGCAAEEQDLERDGEIYMGAAAIASLENNGCTPQQPCLQDDCSYCNPWDENGVCSLENPCKREDCAWCVEKDTEGDQQ